MNRRPADLLGAESDEVLEACRLVADPSRLRDLLMRGFQLSQAFERWRSRAIWVVSRADPAYPERLKSRLQGHAPAILYGCGEPSLLDDGGLAIVGSRNIDDALAEYTMAVGGLVASAGKSVVSGGARGIDQSAMRGALDAGGRVCGVLADSLERQVMTRDHRNLIMEGRLTLVSPYDPGAGFNVGNAMQRNKVIYALADASLVVSSDLNKGGTWAGAVEQLDKYRFTPVYVRVEGETSAGLEALRRRGARPWPDFQSSRELGEFLDDAGSSRDQAPSLLDEKGAPGRGVAESRTEIALHQPTERSPAQPAPDPSGGEARGDDAVCGEDASLILYGMVSQLIQDLLTVPMRDADVAARLDVTPAQAKAWLARLVGEGVVRRSGKPALYARSPSRLI
jgi:predicted Rossmann fold nucleotide-binding protein DprA/Smf involved in DNA uptake